MAVADDWDERDTLQIVPRNQFPERGGLWEAQEDLPSTKRDRRDTWDVVILRAPFSSKPQRWQFARDGLRFSARMEDPNFLKAIAERRVPISIQEGVEMRVEIEYREELDGQTWVAIDRSRKIVRVLSPRPLTNPTSNKP